MRTSGTRLSREELEAILVELQSHPAALSSLRELAGGNRDPLDTLRWRINPDALGAAGETNPRLAIPALERIVHSRPTDDADRERIAAATAELAALMERNAADDRALDEALRQIREEQAMSDVVAVAPLVDAIPTTPKKRFSPSQVLVAGALGLVLLVTLVVITSRAAPPSSLAVFDRPQTAEEALLEGGVLYIGYAVDSGSARIVGRNTSGVAVAYLNRAPMVGQELSPVCLSLLNEDALGNIFGACASEESFAKQGIGFTVGASAVTYDVQWGPAGDAALVVLKE